MAALSKDKRLPDAEREDACVARLAGAEWQVIVCKLADVYDNLHDVASMPAERRAHALERSRFYLEALRGHVPPRAKRFFRMVEQALKAVASPD